MFRKLVYIPSLGPVAGAVDFLEFYAWFTSEVESEFLSKASSMVDEEDIMMEIRPHDDR